MTPLMLHLRWWNHVQDDTQVPLVHKSLASALLALSALSSAVELITDRYLPVPRYMSSVPSSGGPDWRHRPYIHVSRIVTKASIIYARRWGAERQIPHVSAKQTPVSRLASRKSDRDFELQAAYETVGN